MTESVATENFPYTVDDGSDANGVSMLVNKVATMEKAARTLNTPSQPKLAIIVCKFTRNEMDSKISVNKWHKCTYFTHKCIIIFKIRLPSTTE